MFATHSLIGQSGFVRYVEEVRDAYNIKHEEEGILSYAVLIFYELEAIYYTRKKGLNQQSQDQKHKYDLQKKGDNISDEEFDELMSHAKQRKDGSLHLVYESSYDKVGLFNHVDISNNTLTSREEAGKKNTS